MQKFVKKYPEIYNLCEAAYTKLRQNGFPETEEISFDLIFPFLLPLSEKNVQLKMSYELSVYRELIDNYNKNTTSEYLLKLFFDSARYYPISLKDYIYFNRKRDIIDNDIVKSYEFSADRVFYRFSTLLNYKEYFNSEGLFISLMTDIKKISAFLLFDDDMSDLADDFEWKKNTILSKYLQFEKTDIKFITDVMIAYVKTVNNNMLSDFINEITVIYE